MHSSLTKGLYCLVKKRSGESSYKFIGVLICSLLSACSHTPSSVESPEATSQDLSQAIKALSSEVRLQDANQAANALIRTANLLRDEYDMASPALYHNVLVNMGFRQRGLCCHWAEDLHAAVRKLNVGSLKFDWLVSRLGSELREHNVLVIYAASASWQQGLVFDPWRKAGKPYWTAVEGDKYPWELHPLNGRWDVLRCK